MSSKLPEEQLDSFGAASLDDTLTEHFACHLTGMKLEVGLYLRMSLISAMTEPECELMMTQKNADKNVLATTRRLCHKKEKKK